MLCKIKKGKNQKELVHFFAGQRNEPKKGHPQLWTNFIPRSRAKNRLPSRNNFMRRGYKLAPIYRGSDMHPLFSA
jgi:hypothetical protein